MELKNFLKQGLYQLSLSLNENQIEQLLKYLHLLIKWNKSFNLTAIVEPEKIVTLHLLDSLSVSPYLTGQYWADVGAGAGLPGIPLAIAFPDYHFTLIDSNGKKTRFMFQAIIELGLKNCEIKNNRVELLTTPPFYDGIITRAFASISNIVRDSHHLLNDKGRFWIMKGIDPKQELSELGKDYKVLNLTKLYVPGVDGERHLIELGKVI